ncbi:single-stranded-DNA-specific exonuclease RecJ [Thiomicrorhabdus indica]|uniref:single-stranded-DNA-specific exonuclease RecJ n=1 Tax=Thiomicrorhabdus indica TaxID=2267253 RepID=UPI00102DCE07|nr:DHH family phosphoesterase [Thiomicrorhabdus indica]
MKTPPQPKILLRNTNSSVFEKAKSLGLTDLQAKLVANRINQTEDLEYIVFPKLKNLQNPNQLYGAKKAAGIIADAIQSDGLIVLATDYDTDGVTSAWVARTALIEHFDVPESRIQQIIGERKSGYGITEEVVERILELQQSVSLVISADQGSSDEARIARLKSHGIQVCVTDHHQIPLEGVPESAVCTVNPQQPECDYDKTVAGCFVIFLVMTQVRQELIQRNVLSANSPTLKNLLMNVALGTVADSVSLQSPNNRAVVLAGLQQINQLNSPAWQAMRQLNNNNHQDFDAEFLGFQVATRINAASRVSDVTTAYRFLTAKSLEEAQYYLQQLDTDNLNRREQQNSMLLQASEIADNLYQPGRYSLAIKMQGNAGIQGIIASRIGEKYGIPTVAMTELEDGYLAGSGRGIVPNIDLREAFQSIENNRPGIFKSMGGHAGAAGCMIQQIDFEIFQEEFEAAIQKQIGEEPPYPFVETDGELQPWQLTPQLIDEINALQPFGRAWPSPCFAGKFAIDAVRVIGKTRTHLSFKLVSEHQQHINAVYFNALNDASEEIPFAVGDQIKIAFQPSLNHFMNQTTLQLRILTAQLM